MQKKGSLTSCFPPQGRADAGISIDDEEKEKYKETRERLRQQLKEGKLDNRYVDVEVREKVMPFGVISNVGLEELEINLKEMLGGLIPDKAKRKKAKVPEALRILVQEEANKLIDMDTVTKEAIERVQQTGIIFIDEIDKVASRGHAHGPTCQGKAFRETCSLLLKAQL